MDATLRQTLRQTLSGALIATGCLCSAASHAYSAADDAEAQDREVKAAYDRGYKAAKEELARAAATKSAPAGKPAATATAAAAQKPTPETPRKPILDIKHVYSDASDVEIVKEVPVTSKPLSEQQGAAAAATDDARAAPPPSVARRASTAQFDASTDPDALQSPPQPVQRAAAQVRRPSAQRVPQQDAMPAEEFADDDSDEAVAPRAAQVYATEPQYARPRARYAPPPVAARPPPQAYAPQTYAYAQRPTYVATRPYGYYPPQAAWGDAYQPAPYAGRWYWSPEYGRWLYY